jgi:hypothetical protein
MPERTRERSFDELAKGLAGGTVSRRKALRLMGAALVGGALASFPGAAWAAKGGGGGKSACAKYCKTLFGGDTAAQAECTAQGTKGTGPCFACGGPENPAPTCGSNETLNTKTCQCYKNCTPGEFNCCPGIRSECVSLIGGGTVCATHTRCEPSCNDCHPGEPCISGPSGCPANQPAGCVVGICPS